MTDIPPVLPNLSVDLQPSLSIPPRPVYHPAIINACKEMFGKTPSQLNNEEISEFKYYQEFKLSNCDPIEEDAAYFPVGGLRNCLQCGQLTYLYHQVHNFNPWTHPSFYLGAVVFWAPQANCHADWHPSSRNYVITCIKLL